MNRAEHYRNCILQTYHNNDIDFQNYFDSKIRYKPVFFWSIINRYWNMYWKLRKQFEGKIEEEEEDEDDEFYSDRYEDWLVATEDRLFQEMLEEFDLEMLKEYVQALKEDVLEEEEIEELEECLEQF